MPTSTTALPGLALRPASPTPSPAAATMLAAAVSAAPVPPFFLPEPLSLFDQGTVSCCVSCALSGAMEVIDRRSPGLSALFHYHVARVKQGMGGADGLLLIEEGAAVLESTGVCDHALHSFAISPETLSMSPSADAFRDASNHRIRRVGLRFAIESISATARAVDIRSRLLSGCPVVIGFRRPVEFPEGILNSQFEWTDPLAGAGAIAGHCVLAYGFSDARSAFRIRDSQGPNRFDQGGWWMSYSVANSAVVQSAFCLIP